MEELRSVVISVSIDTNKRTEEESFTNPHAFLRWWNARAEGLGLPALVTSEHEDWES